MRRGSILPGGALCQVTAIFVEGRAVLKPSYPSKLPICRRNRPAEGAAQAGRSEPDHPGAPHDRRARDHRPRLLRQRSSRSAAISSGHPRTGEPQASGACKAVSWLTSLRRSAVEVDLAKRMVWRRERVSILSSRPSRWYRWAISPIQRRVEPSSGVGRTSQVPRGGNHQCIPVRHMRRTLDEGRARRCSSSRITQRRRRRRCTSRRGADSRAPTRTRLAGRLRGFGSVPCRGTRRPGRRSGGARKARRSYPPTPG